MLVPGAVVDARKLRVPWPVRVWAIVVAALAGLAGVRLRPLAATAVLCLAFMPTSGWLSLRPPDAIITAAVGAVIGLEVTGWALLGGALLWRVWMPPGPDAQRGGRVPVAAVLLAGFLLLLPLGLPAQSPAESHTDGSGTAAGPRLHVERQPISLTLGVLAEIGGFTALLDDTVVGTVSLSANLDDPRALFTEVAEANGSYIEWSGNTASVSRIRIRPLADGSGRYDLDAMRAPLSALLHRLHTATGLAVVLDADADPVVDLHLRGLEPELLLRQALQQVPALLLEARGDTWVVSDGQLRLGDPGPQFFTSVVGEHGVRWSGIRQSVLLTELARAAGLTLLQLPDSDPVLPALELIAADSEQLLRLGLERLNLVSVRNGTELRVRTPAEAAGDTRFFGTRRVILRHRSAETVLNLLSRPAVSGGWHCRIDSAGNSLEFTAGPLLLQDLVRRAQDLDVPQQSMPLLQVDLQHRDASVVLAALQVWLGPFAPLATGPRSFTVRLPVSLHGRLREEISVLDRPPESETYSLSHRSASEVLLRLPSAVLPEEIRGMPDPWQLQLTGSPSRLGWLRDTVNRLDAPVPQIRYQVLVVQRTRQNRASWDTGITVDQLLGSPEQAPDAATVLQGAFGELLDIDLDLFATFGWLFAVQLSAGLAGDAMQVLADTSITGLAGESLTLSSLETFRYREPGSVDSGSAASVTREISSGLVLELSGELTGGGAVEIAVRASISARGSDDATDVNPPATSERLVQTRIRTRSGVPIVIGGLILESEVKSSRHGGPFAAIPILRLLGGSRRQDRERSELTIYILPRVESEHTEDSVSLAESLLAGLHWPQATDAR